MKPEMTAEERQHEIKTIGIDFAGSAVTLVNQVQQLLGQKLYKDADTAAEKMLRDAFARGRASVQPQSTEEKDK